MPDQLRRVCSSSELLLGEERVLKLDPRKKTLHDLLAAMLGDEIRFNTPNDIQFA